MYKLLTEFKKTGHSVIVNTSFNFKGEPIVCTLKDCIYSFGSADIDALIIENFISFK